MVGKGSSLRFLGSINWFAARATRRNTPNRKNDEGALDRERGDGRKKRSKAIAESKTARRPGPLPPKSLLTITASTKQEDSALRGRPMIRSIPQVIQATPWPRSTETLFMGDLLRYPIVSDRTARNQWLYRMAAAAP